MQLFALNKSVGLLLPPSSEASDWALTEANGWWNSGRKIMINTDSSDHWVYMVIKLNQVFKWIHDHEFTHLYEYRGFRLSACIGSVSAGFMLFESGVREKSMDSELSCCIVAVSETSICASFCCGVFFSLILLICVLW